MKKTDEPKSFAALSGELEQLVDRLQQESVPLEEAISAYERGMKLIREAQQRLDSAEQKVQMLSGDGDATAESIDSPDQSDSP